MLILLSVLSPKGRGLWRLSACALMVLLPLLSLRGSDVRANSVNITASGLELSVAAGSVAGFDWPAATITAFPARPQTLAVKLKTGALHSFTRALGDGEMPLAYVEASETGITRIEPIQAVLPPTRIPKTLEKLASGQPLRVAALGTSLVEAGWASEGWLRLLFGQGTEDSRYLVGAAGGGAPKVVLSRYALGGSNSRYTFALLGDALAGEGHPALESPIYDNDLVIVGLLPNGGADRLALFEAVVRKLRARGVEVLLVTDQTFAQRGEGSQLWRDGYFVQKMAERYGCALADTAAYMRAAELRGQSVYKDAIHANQEGYKLWAEAIGGVLSPAFDPLAASGLAESAKVATGTTLQHFGLVPDGAVVDFMPRNSGGVLVTPAPDNRFLKAFNAPDGGVWKIGQGASISLSGRAFMALDLLIDSSSEFEGELRDVDGRKIKQLKYSAARSGGARATVLTALLAAAMADAGNMPASLVITSGELRLYAVIYQTRNPVPDSDKSADAKTGWRTPFPIQHVPAERWLSAECASGDFPEIEFGKKNGEAVSGTVALGWSAEGLLLRVVLMTDRVRRAPLSVIMNPAVDAGQVFNHYDAIEIGVGDRVFAFCPLEDERVAFYYDLLEQVEADPSGSSTRLVNGGWELRARIAWQDIGLFPDEGDFLPLMLRIHASDSSKGGMQGNTKALVIPARAESGWPISYGAAFLAGVKLPEGHATRLESLFGVNLETGAYRRFVRLRLKSNPAYGRMEVAYRGSLEGNKIYDSTVALGDQSIVVELPIGQLSGIARLEMEGRLDGHSVGTIGHEYFSPGARPLAAYRGSMTPPADFDAFWDARRAELAGVPFDAVAEKLPESDESTTLWKVRLNGWRDVPFYAFLAVPVEPGSYPLKMRVYPRVGVTAAKPEKGAVVLAVSPRGFGPSSEFSPPPRPRDLHRSETGKPENLYMLANILDWVRGIDYALTLPEVDPSRVHVSGGSRGGYLAMAIAAADERITSVYATVPAYADVELSGRVGKFPDARQLVKNGSTQEQILQKGVWSYFDAINLAGRIHCRILIEAGMLDNICPAAGIVDAFSRIPSREKILLLNPETGHAATPAGQQMEPILAGWILAQ